ncbi:TerB family tellurite resistance protein [uncultured Dokdonia sp.]|uniref:TerB family tellurite resistance protein n=1 Tax=uncultured Dokdonia sp. TaxID=575653 RepID=UPI0030EBA69B|tara:strand:- start:53840 stop:54235 length:396 start_codon:yes stop_codon:yes gene_type:complete
MNSENFQIISDMLLMAKADNHLHEREYDFILMVARRMGISKDEVDALVKSPQDKMVYKTEMQRLTQFHRLLLVMNVDEETQFVEIDTLRNYGLKLGIRAEAVQQILSEMGDYEHKIIPSYRLVEIFKRFYN